MTASCRRQRPDRPIDRLTCSTTGRIPGLRRRATRVGHLSADRERRPANCESCPLLEFSRNSRRSCRVLEVLRSLGGHQFWPDDVSLLDPYRVDRPGCSTRRISPTATCSPLPAHMAASWPPLIAIWLPQPWWTERKRCITSPDTFQPLRYNKGKPLPAGNPIPGPPGASRHYAC